MLDAASTAALDACLTALGRGEAEKAQVLSALAAEAAGKDGDEREQLLQDAIDHLHADFDAWQPTDKELEIRWASVLQLLTPDADAIDAIKRQWASGSTGEKKRYLWAVAEASDGHAGGGDASDGPATPPAAAPEPRVDPPRRPSGEPVAAAADDDDDAVGSVAAAAAAHAEAAAAAIRAAEQATLAMGERLAAARAAAAAAPRPDDRLSAEAWERQLSATLMRGRGGGRPLAEQVARLVGADADFDAVAEALDAAAQVMRERSGTQAEAGGCVTS